MLEKIKELLSSLHFPERFITEQTAICVIAMLDTKLRQGLLKHCQRLRDGARIHDILNYARSDLSKNYAENTRESLRKSSLKRLVNHRLAICNPDDKFRPTNSGNTNYVLAPDFIQMLEAIDKPETLSPLVSTWLNKNQGLLAKERKFDLSHKVKITLPTGQQIGLSPGKHNLLQKEIVESFAQHFIKAPVLLYLSDTQHKTRYMNKPELGKIGLSLSEHQKLPDIIFYSLAKKRIYALEAVTSVGPIEELRKQEIEGILGNLAGEIKIEFVSCFLDRKSFARFCRFIAWNTKIWLAEIPEGIIEYKLPG